VEEPAVGFHGQVPAPVRSGMRHHDSESGSGSYSGSAFCSYFSY